MSKIIIKISGPIPALGKVPKSVRLKAFPPVVVAVKESAQREAPKRRGFSSKKSIVSRIGGKVERPGERGIVWSRAPHSHLVELGTKDRHATLRRTKSGRLRKNAARAMTIYGSRDILRVSANTGSTEANPFMERAAPGAVREVEGILAREGARQMVEAVKQAVQISEVFG